MPMKEELTEEGFIELLTPDEVDAQLKKPGTTMVVINSVCGCSAGTARPSALMAVQNSPKKPDYLATSFAGFDIDAVRKLREHLLRPSPACQAILVGAQHSGAGLYADQLFAFDQKFGGGRVGQQFHA